MEKQAKPIHHMSEEAQALSESSPNSAKLALLTNLAHLCAEVLKDPSGGKEMSAQARQEARESAYDDLMCVIDTIVAAAEFNSGFFDAMSIATKYAASK